MHASPSAFYTSQSYFSLPSTGATSPSLAATKGTSPLSSMVAKASARKVDSMDFAGALSSWQTKTLAPQPSPFFGSEHRSVQTPTDLQGSPTLTPRKRSPPSAEDTPPHQRMDFFGSGSSTTVTPAVSRLSLKADHTIHYANSFNSSTLPDPPSLANKAHLTPVKSKSEGFLPTKTLPGPNGPGSGCGPTDRFNPISSTALLALLRQPDAEESLLSLDLRPHSTYALSTAGRLPNSINLCIPSTLLRRPNYKLVKVAESLSDSHHRSRITKATQDADVGALKHVVVVDQGSVALTADNPLYHILLKFEAEGFQGQLHWLQGGFEAMDRQLGFDALRETGVPLESKERSPSVGSSAMSLGGSMSGSSDTLGRSWPSSNNSWTSNSSVASLSDPAASKGLQVHGEALPMSAFDGRSTQNYISGTNASMPQKDGMNSRVFTNPFFDSIRQNHEALSYEQSMANLLPIVYPFEDQLKQHAAQLPPFLQSLAMLSPEDRAKRLAREYYDLEAMEQKRMQDLMEWHANVQVPTADAQEEYNPHSISAGVEKGHLNRYRHIFPFEHSRCRLEKFAKYESDYINASHIRFAGKATDKSYVATQGPVMPACGDFYQLIAQERIGVVLMLCNIVEGGREKCCHYFSEGTYGHMQVARPKASPTRAPSGPTASDGFFSTRDVSPQPQPADTCSTSVSSVEVRTLFVSDADQPEKGSHEVKHIQYGAWPDFDVPPSASEVLDLIELANCENEQMAKVNGLQELPPILVHCSAGCGRTGCYMAIDVIIELLRKRRTSSLPLSGVDNAMDIDVVSMPLAEPGRDGRILLRNNKSRTTPPLDRSDPLFSIINEMREQRMSMVANLSQYRFCHEAVLAAELRDLA